MECFEHGKSFIGACTWCGKQLCKVCVGKEKGLKLYCANCAAKLSEFDDRPVIPRTQSTSLSSEIDEELGLKPAKKYPFK